MWAPSMCRPLRLRCATGWAWSRRACVSSTRPAAHGLAIEHNGDVYSCDHFVEPNYLLGNIHDEHMIELVACDRSN